MHSKHYDVHVLADFHLHKTSRSKFLVSCPALLEAMQVYRAVWATWTLVSCRCRPSATNSMPFSVASGRPFRCHSTVGGGIPSTGHSNTTVRLTITRGLSTRLASSMLGGTAETQLYIWQSVTTFNFRTKYSEIKILLSLSSRVCCNTRISSFICYVT